MTGIELPPGVRAQARRASPPVALGRRGSLVVSASVVAHTLWTSAATAMAYRLYADEWHLNHTVTTGIFAIYLSGRRRPDPDRLRRHLRSYRPARHHADGTWRLACRHSAVRGGAGRPVALRGPGPDGRRRRPHRGTFDGGGGRIRDGRPRGKFVAARRSDRDGRAGCRLRRRLAARRRADRLCAVADPAFVLRSGRVAGAPPRRDMVPAASRDGRGHGLAPAPAVRAQRGARGLRDCIGRDHEGLHPRRADPLARRPGRPRPHRVTERPGQRRRPVTVRARLRRRQHGRATAHRADGDDARRRRLRYRDGATRPGGRAAWLARLPAGDGHGWGRIQPAVPQRAAGHQRRRAGAAARRRALRPLSTGLSVDGHGRHHPRHRGDRLGISPGHRSGPGVVALLSLATLARAGAMRASACPPLPLAPGCASSNA